MTWRSAVPPTLALAAIIAWSATTAGNEDEPVAGSAAAPAGTFGPARVQRVVDGDTLKVRLDDGRTKRVRVLGIDSPESRKPGSPVECGALEAAGAMRRLATEGGGPDARGRRVTLVADSRGDQVDRFDRVLAYVEAGGRDLGEQLVAQGWAKAYAFRDRDFDRRDRYERAQAAARAAGRGVHGRCGGDFHRPA
jgi:micrococcal nuclease